MPYGQVLDLSAVPGFDGLFVLGCFAKRITFYSQQCRAINLVDAIQFHSGLRPLKDKRVAVIGAGAAGVTAAARLMEYGADVTVFDKAPDAVSVQGSSRHRWLHPRIYDWPFSAIDHSDVDAGLPVMTWEAGEADKVAKSLDKKFEALRERHASHLKFENKFEVVALAKGTRGIDVTGLKSGVSVPDSHFDLTILAVGFGLEPEGERENSYWEGDPVGATSRDKAVAIAGYGDGALTDVLRASIPKFDQGELLQQIISMVPEALVRRIRSIESHYRWEDPGFLTEKYSSPNVLDQQISGYLKKHAVPRHSVVLAGSGPDLYDPKACAINRFILAHLIHLGVVKHLSLGGDIGTAPDDPVRERLRAFVAEQAPNVEAKILYRFGPKRAITRIGGIESHIVKLEEKWEDLNVAEDLTRQRLWETPFWSESDLSQRCLIFGSADQKQRLALIARNALSKRGLLASAAPLPMDVSSCVASREALLQTARALCSAPLAIFCLGDGLGRDDLASMLLLGVRSVVRRGITLAVKDSKIQTTDWGSLPFNLREIQVLSLPFEFDSADTLGDALLGGFEILGGDAAGYRDLPVFDIVRRTSRRTPPLDEGLTEALALCPFSPEYTQSHWPALQLCLQDIDAIEHGGFRLMRVIDYGSPLLAAERLYELIRYAGQCVADFTEWRPSVFFELGVRLATHPVPPICMIEEGSVPLNGSSERDLLSTLFGPLPYSKNGAGGSSELTDGMARELDRRKTAPTPRASVFSAAERYIAVEQESSAVIVLTRLRRDAEALLGVDVSATGGLPILFGGNRQLEQQALESGLQLLWAEYLVAQVMRQTMEAGTPGAKVGDLLIARTKLRLKELLSRCESVTAVAIQRHLQGATIEIRSDDVQSGER